MKYLDPVGVPCAPRRASVPAELKLTHVAGKTLAIVNNGWTSMTRIGEHLASRALNEHSMREVRFYTVPRNSAPMDDVLHRIRTECDAAIVGLAN